MRTQEEINAYLANEIDSLSQQVTIASIALAAALQELALLDPEASKRVVINFQQVVKAPAAMGKVTAERAKDLLALLEGTLAGIAK